MKIEPIPLLSDNYAYLIVDGGKTAVLDPSEANAIIEFLKDRNLSLDYVLNTHHHGDHSGGNLELKAKTKCQVLGPGHDRDRIPGIDIALFEGDQFSLGNSIATIMHTPGHTRGQINYWFQKEQAIFTGDTLFSLGCGRIFEGSAEQMWSTLDKFRSLPKETKIYFGHEYTLKNAQFALTVEPNNNAVKNRLKIVEELTKLGKATTPALLANELNENPFLRPDSKEIRQTLNLHHASDAEVFGELRRRKDHF